MRYFLLLHLIFLFYNCEKNPLKDNDYFTQVRFNTEINTDLAQYNKLRNILSPVEVIRDGVGLRGIIIIRVSQNQFLAWERTCPNEPIQGCSTLKIIDAIKVQCPCNGEIYNLINGLSEQNPNHFLRNYRVEHRGNKLLIYN